MDLPLLTGKLCLVTGATAGVGFETALGLAYLGAQVVIAGRDPRKCGLAIRKIRRVTGNPSIHFLAADLSSLRAIRFLAIHYKNTFPRLDILVNSVGALFHYRRESVDGIEMNLALNYLGHFLLTHSLMDLLVASAPARIINLTSPLYTWAELDFADLQCQRQFSGLRAYSRSQLAEVLFTYELARRLQQHHIVVNAAQAELSFSPLDTSLPEHAARKLHKNRANNTLLHAACTSLYLAASPDIGETGGECYIGPGRLASPLTAGNLIYGRKLWMISQRITRARVAV